MRGFSRILLLALFTLCSLVFAIVYGVIDRAEAARANGEVAIITGRVYSDLFNFPMPDVNVILINPNAPDERFTAATTNDDGIFTVTQTISATWIIRFESTNPQLDEYLPEYYDDTFDIDAAKRITANVGTVIEGINVSLARVGQVSGRVTAEENGLPLAGVQVIFVRADSGDGFTNTSTDESGAYTTTLPLGERFKVRFDPPSTLPYGVEVYDDVLSLSEGQTIVPEPERDLRLNAALAPAGVITGVATSSWYDKPLESPTVFALNEAGERVAMGYREIQGPENPLWFPLGHYAIANLPPGNYQLLFMAEGHRAHLREEMVTVTAGMTTTEVNARLTISPQVLSLATSPALPNVFAITFRHDPIPLVSLNRGQNWQVAPSTPWITDPAAYLSPDRHQILGVVAGIVPRDETTGDLRLLIAAGRPFGAPEPLQPGIYRSGDVGQSWATSTVTPPLDPDSCFEGEFRTPAVTPVAPDKIYLLLRCMTGGFSHLLVSQDAGVSWEDVSTVDGRTLILYPAARVVASPFVEDEIYVYDGGSQWYKSMDSGRNWSPVSFPVEYFVFDAKNPNLLSGWTSRYNAPYTRTGKRSIDGGSTWQDWVQQPCRESFEENPPQLVAHPTDENVLFVRCDNLLTPGIYRSDSNGDYWKKLTEENGQMLAADYGTPARILWVRDDGLWASSDLGESWQRMTENYGVGTRPLYIPSIRAAD